jgi:diguanylate cyclase (GGDEF)-like protein/PAS domain S-box-containing protein
MISLSLLRRIARQVFTVSLLPGFAFVLLIAMWIAVFHQLTSDQRTAHHEAVLQSQSLARTLAEHVTYILRQTDHATQLFRLEFSKTRGAARLEEFVRPDGLMDSVLPAKLELPIGLIDVEGNVIDSQFRFPTANVKREAFFRVLADGSGPSPQFSTPVIDPLTRKWMIQVARRLTDAEGNFAGAVVIMVDPSYFVDDYDRLSMDERGALLLMAPQPGLSVGRVGDHLFISDTLRFGPAGRGSTSEELAIRTPFDQVDRIYSSREMPRFSLTALVGIPADTALARFMEHRQTYLTLAVAASLLIIAIVAGLMRQSARLRASMMAARQAQSTLRAAAEGSLDGFVVLSAWPSPRTPSDFVFTDVNERGADMLGLARDALLGQRAFAALPQYRGTGLFESYAEVMKSGQAMVEELEIHLPDDIPRWISQQIVPIDGGVAVTVRDITHRKHVEFEIRNSRSFLQSLIDHVPLLIYVRSVHPDTHGRMLVWNRAAEELTGYPAGQVVGRTVAEAFPPGFGLTEAGRDQAGADARTLVDVEDKPFLHRDGSTRHLHVMSVPLFDESGRPEYILSIAEDVTRRREQEQALADSAAALRESEARIRTIANTVPAMIAYIDSDATYRFHNAAYDREFGLANIDVNGRTIRETVGEERYARLEPYIRRVLNGETVVFEETDTREGLERTLEVTYIPQFAEDRSAVVGFHVMRQDITVQKREKTRLQRLAQVDVLTGLTNRAGFEQKLGDAMASADADRHLMAVMYMDIDRFKPVNDTYGHDVGDALLKAFSSRLTHTLRASDTIARLGGDEFTIIMEKISRPGDASVIAGKIVAAMRLPFELDGITVSISTSIGLAYYRGEGRTPDDLLKEADVLMYKAKQEGRDTYRAAA